MNTVCPGDRRWILRAALLRAGGGTPLLVGDRLDTDVEGAPRLGWDSLLVLTGITIFAVAIGVLVGTSVTRDARAVHRTWGIRFRP